MTPTRAKGDEKEIYEDDYERDETCDLCSEPLEECTCDDCGLQPNGLCLLAGTEWCDWKCKSK